MAQTFLSELSNERQNAGSQRRHDVTMPALVSAACERFPQRIAISCVGEEISYAELERRSNNVARGIRSCGARRGHIVAVALRRGADALVAMLGVMKSGSAYLPVDPDYPLSRRQYMIDDAAAVLLIADGGEQPDAGAIRALAQIERLAVKETAPPDPVSPDQLAYVIYTSGSTGKPKGVAMNHRPLSSMVQWHCERWREEARVMQFTSLSFDVSLQEIFTTWVTGGTLVVCDDDEKRDAARLAQRLHEERIERLFLPFVGLQQLATAVEEGAILPTELRQICTAGEALVVTPAIRALFLRLPSCRLYNQYGPTESHVVVCEYALSEDPMRWLERPPIGKALAGARLFILDEHLQPITTAGVTGEIFIGGDAVLAQGYLGQEALTRERFIASPFQAGERLYRTGDRARWDENGDIHYQGREDHQLKIRGHRVEPGEVEAALNGHPQVATCAVIADRDGTGGTRLLACVIPISASGLTPAELRDYLARRLPEFMLPSQVVFMERLPLTSSFKLDRRALLAGLLADRPTQRVTTATEQALAEVWQNLLALPTVSVADDFFALGGHSLLATAMLAAVRRRFGVALTMSDILAAPELAQLAQRIDLHAGQAPASWPNIEADDDARYRPFPLSAIQQAYWLGRERIFELGNISTHLYLEIDIHRPDLSRLEWAWRQLIARHDMLRAVILPDGQQQIMEQTPEWSLAWQDLTPCGEQEKRRRLQKWRDTLSHQIHDPLQWPLFDIRASRMNVETTRLHISLDLLVVDALSQYILLYEWGCLYHQGENALTVLPAFNFRDYQLALERIRQTAAWRQDRDYWQARLVELPPAPELPLACSPHSLPQPRFVRRDVTLEPELWRRIQRRAAAQGVTSSAVLLTLYAEIIARWSASPAFTLNLTLFNRLPLHDRIDELVGDFTSTMLLDCRADSTGTFIALVKQMQERLWHCLDHRLYSGVEVLRDLGRLQGAAQGVSMPVVFTSALGLKTRGIDGAAFKQLGELHWALTQTSQVWLDNQVSECDGALICYWDALEDVFPAGVLDAMFDGWQRLLHQLAEDESCWHWQVPWDFSLPQALQRQMRANQTDGPISDELLHSLFYRRSRSAPQATAVIVRGETLSYDSLARLSNHLAWTLRHHGCEEGDRVAILMEKGWRQVAAALAASECGAVWLPLDPTQPVRRQRQIIQQADVRMLVVASADQPTFDAGLPVIAVADDETARHHIVMPLPVAPRPDDAAYIIYTSGSTGVPKGVTISHRGAVNTVLDINRRVKLDAQDRVFALSALSFDLSVYDIFGTLAAGAALVMPDAERYRDPGHWLDLMHHHRVTLWNSVPALAQMLTDYIRQNGLPSPEGLRYTLLSGDWIPLSLPESLWQCWPTLNIMSLGGATEASIWSIAWRIEAVSPDWASIPYGLPLDNQRVYVLDARLQFSPDWVTGDIYIAGTGLALGYFNDAERTVVSFIVHPQSGERLYRTGDRGRWRPEGYIEFLGRQDCQVKLAGYRIETSEVEWALMRCKGVRAAKVIFQRKEGHLPRLIAGVCGEIPDMEALRAQLAEWLPAYMLPSHIVLLTAFPLTANGKLDTASLLARADACEREKQREIHVPQTPTQRWLADCWQTLLGAAALSIDSNFFSCGGDSLLATYMFAQLRVRYSQRTDFSVVTLFQYPTIRGLAAFLDGDVAAARAQQGRGELRRRVLARRHTHRDMPRGK